jgi:hypothetical protein
MKVVGEAGEILPPGKVGEVFIRPLAGAGTTYGTGTVAHPDVEATTNTNTTQVIEAQGQPWPSRA